MPHDWYDLVMNDESCVSAPLLVGKEDFYGVDPFELKHGKFVDNWSRESRLWSTSPDDDGEPLDIVFHFGVPILSPRLQHALAGARIGQNDIQFLPVKLFKSTGEEIGGFAIANVISRIPALDYERCKMLQLDESKTDPVTGKPAVKSVWTVALRAATLVGHDVIRLAEFFPPILVSERFARVFHQGKFTGATLYPVPVS